MEQKKSWILRPVAWVCTAAMWVALSGVAYLLCRLGDFLTGWLGTLPTLAVVILSVLFGGIFCGLFLRSAFLLPSWMVTISDKIYPTRRAVRFYVIGGYTLLGCGIVILAAILGAVRGVSMFWFYVRFCYIAAASVITMFFGYATASERNGTEEGAAALAREKQNPKNEKVREFFVKVGITAAFWGIARLIPAVVNGLSPMGFWYPFFAAFLLPFGWGAAIAISKGKRSNCVRVNLYVLAALEGLATFSEVANAVSRYIARTGQYMTDIYNVLWSDYPRIYGVALLAGALYVGICVYLAWMTDRVKS